MFSFPWTNKETIDTPKGFLQAIKKLRAKNIPTPLCDEFEKLLDESIVNPEGKWYKDQGEHWEGWLREYDGPGFYNRKNHARTSKYIYNHIMCPPMLVWLAETVGIEENIIKQATKEALLLKKYQEQCGVIRKQIDWEKIASTIESFYLSKKL